MPQLLSSARYSRSHLSAPPLSSSPRAQSFSRANAAAKAKAPYTPHKPVLLSFILKHILKPTDEYIVDATLGEGGHTQAFLKKEKRVIGLDADSSILEAAQQRLSSLRAHLTIVNDNFKNIAASLIANKEQTDLVLFDLGISRFHYFKSGRGFSVHRDEHLDMRIDNREIMQSAYAVIQTFSVAKLVQIFKTYGEERHAMRYASAIVLRRKKKPFVSSAELAEFIASISPFYKKYTRIHPATKVFQALRIYVNGELTALSMGILGAITLLSSGGRLVVISYHSLEDRIVKNLFKRLSQSNDTKRRYLTPSGGLSLLQRALHPLAREDNSQFQDSKELEVSPRRRLRTAEFPVSREKEELEHIRTLTEKHSYRLGNNRVIRPTEAEIYKNKAARSAKLRFLIRT